MKFHLLSLALVASVALARPIPDEATQLDSRALIGDEYSVHNLVDNSVGKNTLSVDHNGDSSVRKGLLHDLIDSDYDNDDRFLRRSLLGGLLGSERTSVENINDNSEHKETVNEHHNKDIKKIHTTEGRRRHHHRHEYDDHLASGDFYDRRSDEPQLERRGLLGGLLGDSRTSISNVNDNSKSTKTYNSHGNTYKEDIRHRTYLGGRRHRKRDDEEVDLDEEEKEEEEEEETVTQLEAEEDEGDEYEEADMGVKKERRGLLLGDSSTSISNVNDNSKTTKNYNSHNNVHKAHDSRDSREHYFGSRGSSCRRHHRHHRHHHRYDKREMMEGSQMESEDTNNNVERSTSTDVETIEYEIEEPWTTKRSDDEKRSLSRTRIEFESVSRDRAEGESIAAEGSQAQEKVEDNKRSLVTIQIINTNTNRNSKDANLIYTVTPDRPHHRHKQGPSRPTDQGHNSSQVPDYSNKKRQPQQEIRHSKGIGKKRQPHQSHLHKAVKKSMSKKQ
ncbi:hypothetical protein BGZ73_005793 [Actinomortierella ambigua]|nr:hypothetical protein BGZ73_005793 [Actinomortierella ambigua]